VVSFEPTQIIREPNFILSAGKVRGHPLSRRGSKIPLKYGRSGELLFKNYESI